MTEVLDQRFPRAVKLFWAWNVTLGVLCVLYTRLLERHLLHKGWPYTSPFLPFYRFWDYRCYMARFPRFHSQAFFSSDPGLGFPFEYPAPVALVYKAFYALGTHSFWWFAAFAVSGVLVLTGLLWQALRRRAIKTSTVALFLVCTLGFSYPFWFEGMLGNMEIVVFLLIASAVICWLRGYSQIAAVLIGIATAMKIFPAVYLGLFLSRKQYKEMAICTATTIGVNLVALWAVCPNLSTSMHGIAAGLAQNREHYMLHYLVQETGVDHSAFGFIKCIYGFARHTPLMPETLLKGYLAVAAISGILLYFLMIRKLPVINQVAALCIASVLLPPTSHDYTLIHLYVPFALMVLLAVDRPAEAASQTFMLGTFFCFALLFSPEAVIIRQHPFSAQLKALVLIALFAMFMRHPFRPGKRLIAEFPAFSEQVEADA